MAFPINDLGTWTVGQLTPNFELLLGRDNRLFDLTGVTANQLSLLLYNASKVQIGTGAGSFAINNFIPAVVTYTQVAADMITTLAYVKVKVNFGGTSPDFSDFIKIQVTV